MSLVDAVAEAVGDAESEELLSVLSYSQPEGEQRAEQLCRKCPGQWRWRAGSSAGACQGTGTNPARNTLATWPTPFPKMKKKVRLIRSSPPQNVSLTPSGPFNGCIGEREDLHALPHLVRSVPSRAADHESCGVEQTTRTFF